MRRSRRPGDRGSMSVEMTTLVFPVTVVMVVFLLGAWQLSLARLDTHTAAAAAARAASLQPNPVLAEDAARETAAAVLADAGRACSTLHVEVLTSAFGRSGYVEVEVTCHVTTGDLIGLQAPGSAPTAATARSPIETYVQLEGGMP
jgi:Flp pilus assembly protein TadG